jgi:O-acetyl-ADP-ribose deacetylase
MKKMNFLLVLTIIGFQGITHASQQKIQRVYPGANANSPVNQSQNQTEMGKSKKFSKSNNGEITYTLPNGKIIYVTKPGTDIVKMTRANAIINAANKYLLLGGGVAGAIKDAAGPDVQVQCDELLEKYGTKLTIPAIKTTGWTSLPKIYTKAVPVGSAWTTSAYHLLPEITYIIHAVGPDCREEDEKNNFEATLKSAYEDIFQEAVRAKIPPKSLAIPLLSSNIFKCNFDKCVQIAVTTVVQELLRSEHVEAVYFVAFDQQTYKAYQKALDDELIVPAAHIP